MQADGEVFTPESLELRLWGDENKGLTVMLWP